MREKVERILEEHKKAFEINELAEMLSVKTVDGMTELSNELRNLEEIGKIYTTNKGKYMNFKHSHLKVGRLTVNEKGFGFVAIQNEPDIRIDERDINGAIENDLVAVELLPKKGGKIVKVIKREIKDLVGEYYLEEDGKHYVKLDNGKYKIKVVIATDNSKGAMPGHKVVVKVNEMIASNVYNGEVLKVLGHKSDLGVDVRSIVYAHGISDVFTDDVMNEVNGIKTEVTKEDLANRRDLREETIFTIDGEDAKDLDDAVSVKKLENGNYLLGVHIADVSYYVKENGAIDREAYDRGTSVYLVDRVIPMLPHRLSNGICSLNGNVDRLAVSCDMEINEAGEVVNYDIYESVIHSKKRMTYSAVNEILEKNHVPEGYEPFVKSLKEMQMVSLYLRKAKVLRGYLDFETNEMKIIVDENSVPTNIKLREQGIGEKIIEDFMIAANETVASHIFFMELPFVYRVHEYPKEEKVRNFLRFMSALGYHIKAKGKDMHPKEMQRILDFLRDKEEFPILSTIMLRTMQKAFYQKDNIGHYGLASKCYTHFTSPIRRYPDTTVHRLLRTYLFNAQTDAETRDYWNAKLGPLAEHSSLKERESVECERDVEDLKSAEYMEQFIGQEFEGMISSVLPFGMFVQLPNLVEGLVHISDMDDDYYIYDEKRMSLVGEHSKNVYRIGNKVKIVVKNASREAKKIDFQIVKERINQKSK